MFRSWRWTLLLTLLTLVIKILEHFALPPQFRAERGMTARNAARNFRARTDQVILHNPHVTVGKFPRKFWKMQKNDVIWVVCEWACQTKPNSWYLQNTFLNASCEKLKGGQKILKNAEKSCDLGSAWMSLPNKAKLTIFAKYFFKHFEKVERAKNLGKCKKILWSREWLNELVKQSQTYNICKILF